VVKRKADSIAAAVVDDLSTAIQVPYVPVNHSLVELTSQAADLSTLMDALKEKVNASSKFSERIQLLTLTPDSWSRERVATEFEVSEHVVRAARKLKEEKGILPAIYYIETSWKSPSTIYNRRRNTILLRRGN